MIKKVTEIADKVGDAIKILKALIAAFEAFTTVLKLQKNGTTNIEPVDKGQLVNDSWNSNNS
jgi:hypothetical protein